MVRVTRVLDEIGRAVPPFDVVDANRRARSARALARAVDLTLRLQIRVRGGLTGWGQQYRRTDAGAGGRADLRASVDRQHGDRGRGPVPDGRRSPDAGDRRRRRQAVDWLRRSAHSGIRLDRRADPSLPHGFDLTEIADPSAPPLWARFYAIDTNRPIYSGRDGIVRSRLAEIEVERRTGYSWMGPYAQRLLNADYPAWIARIRPGLGSYNWTYQS